MDAVAALAEDALVIWPEGLPKEGADLTAQHAAVDRADAAAALRLGVEELRAVFAMKKRRACRVVGLAPATYYYGARTQRDLCFEKELDALTETLPGFTFVPALSEADESEPWDGEVGLITDVVRRHETDLSGTDSYVCGPPPMVEAAMDVLSDLGAPEKNIYYDKFTTTGPA